MNPPDEKALLQQAVSLARSGQKADAHTLLRKIVDKNPRQEMAWLWLVQTEPDIAQQILILQECLRHNPKSEYAKKGLSSLRAQVAVHPAPPAKKPPIAENPIAENPKPRKPKKTSRGASGIWKIIFIVIAFALAATLIGGGVLLYPKFKDRLPNFLHGANAPAFTVTLTPSAPGFTDTPAASSTPTVTRTRTATFTPSRTYTPTVSPTPTLFQGAPIEGELSLLFMDAVSCEAVSVPISGGPQALTDPPPDICLDAKISPDGARIGFVGGQNQEILQSVNVDGTDLKPIFKLPKGSGFDRSIWGWQWSPNGKKIALVAPNMAKDDPGFLYTGLADSPGAMKLIKVGGIQNSLAGKILWSPDSQWIFVWDMGLPDLVPYPSSFRDSDSRSVIISYLKNVPGLTPNYHFDWSPDSRFLSFISTQKPVTDALATEIPADQAYIVKAGLDKTLEYVPLPMSEGSFDPLFGALWSPDASGFLLLDSSKHQLVLIGNDGQVKSRLAVLRDTPHVVQWSPDGQWISIVEMVKADDTAAVVEIVRADGTDFRILATGAALQPVVWK
jgi:hypothetical protein